MSDIIMRYDPVLLCYALVSPDSTLFILFNDHPDYDRPLIDYLAELTKGLSVQGEGYTAHYRIPDPDGSVWTEILRIVDQVEADTKG